MDICKCGHDMTEFKGRRYHITNFSETYEHLNYRCGQNGCICTNPEVHVPFVKQPKSAAPKTTKKEAKEAVRSR